MDKDVHSTYMENIIKFCNHKLVTLSQKLKKLGIEVNDVVKFVYINTARVTNTSIQHIQRPEPRLYFHRQTRSTSVLRGLRLLPSSTEANN